jgi:hydroxypyruvate isomerase
MPKFAANLSFLFQDLPFLERFAAALAAGFRYVEYMFPYPYSPQELQAKLKEHKLEQVPFNLPEGNWEAGDRGIAAHPEWVAEFGEGVKKALEYAPYLGAKQINVLAGKQLEGCEAEQHKVLVENLKYAAKALGDAGLTLLIEPINTYDIPGFLVNTTQQGLGIIAEVGASNLELQYDIYHMQRMEGHITQSLREHLDKIGHIQIADVPGRGQPGTGELNYPFLLAELDRIGYAGYVGLEYVPKPDTLGSLGWVKEYGFSLS